MRQPTFSVLLGDALEQLHTLPENHFHCCVTSPPYWGLRDYQAEGMIGLEQTWSEFLEKLLDVFSEVRRVLRPDGVAWVNMGDAYSQKGKSAAQQADASNESRVDRLGYQTRSFGRTKGWCKATGTRRGIDLDEKQLMMQPARLALGLQERGWYLRSEVTWRKPNATPSGIHDRPHVDNEKIFLITKTKSYFYDRFAWMRDGFKLARNTWDIPVKTRSGHDHWATFPIELPRRCILLGSSAQGCCEACGTPVDRVVEPTEEYGARLGKSFHDHKEDLKKGHRCGAAPITGPTYVTVGWKPGCSCGTPTIPCRVLDPFSGSGTTGLAALELGRDYIGCEINPSYRDGSLSELKRKALCLSEEDEKAGQLSLLEAAP